MIAQLKNVLDDMESGVYNYCKDGECIGCGRCCSAILPLSRKEIKEIQRYVKKHHIKPALHVSPAVNTKDLTCPFLDETKTCEKCLVYPVRPKICKVFQCNQPPSAIEENKRLFWNSRQGMNLWELFK